MNIFALQGKANKGKTRTLIFLIKELCNKQINKLFCQKTGPEDYCAKFKHKGKKIGITTHGDDRSVLENDFNLLGDDCDIYVCAVRTKGETVEFVEEKSKGDTLVFFGKATYDVPNSSEPQDKLESKQKKINEYQAQLILCEIEEFLK